jgi:hypothetical protein
MEASDFDELAFFRAIARSGVRALLIGRRALVLLGLPVLTADYDFWIDIEQIARFNAAAAPFGLRPTRSPEDARRTGRYALENDEHVDVLVARTQPRPMAPPSRLNTFGTAGVRWRWRLTSPLRCRTSPG